MESINLGVQKQEVSRDRGLTNVMMMKGKKSRAHSIARFQSLAREHELMGNFSSFASSLSHGNPLRLGCEATGVS